MDITAIRLNDVDLEYTLNEFEGWLSATCSTVMTGLESAVAEFPLVGFLAPVRRRRCISTD